MTLIFGVLCHVLISRSAAKKTPKKPPQKSQKVSTCKPAHFPPGENAFCCCYCCFPHTGVAVFRAAIVINNHLTTSSCDCSTGGKMKNSNQEHRKEPIVTLENKKKTSFLFLFFFLTHSFFSLDHPDSHIPEFPSSRLPGESCKHYLKNVRAVTFADKRSLVFCMNIKVLINKLRALPFVSKRDEKFSLELGATPRPPARRARSRK